MAHDSLRFQSQDSGAHCTNLAIRDGRKEEDGRWQRSEECLGRREEVVADAG